MDAVILIVFLAIFSLFIQAVTGNAHAEIYNPHPTPTKNSITGSMIINGTITNADINSVANISLSKLAGTPSTEYVPFQDIYGLATTSNMFYNNTNGALTIWALAVRGSLMLYNDISYHWPSSQGDTSTVLTNNGSGYLSWISSIPKVLSTPMLSVKSINVPAEPIAVMANNSLNYPITFVNEGNKLFNGATDDVYTSTLYQSATKNPLVIINVNLDNNVTTAPVVTLGNVTMSLATTTSSTVANAGSIYTYYAIGIPEGTYTITTTFSSSLDRYMTISYMNYSGVSQSNPIGNTLINKTNTTENITTTQVGDWVVTSASAETAEANGTNFYIRDSDFEGIYIAYGDSNGVVPVGSVPISVDYGSATYYLSQSLVIHPYRLPIEGIHIASSLTQSDVNGYMGFVTATTTANNITEVTYCGVLSGFTGLTIGKQYYLQDTGGAISTTTGTINKPVGNAINSTKLRIYCN